MGFSRRSHKIKNEKGKLMTYSQRNSPISDQFRTILANIQFLVHKEKERNFVLTGLEEGIGTSTIVSNLAVSRAYQGEKVLIIDANLKNPSLHEIFKISNGRGLADILSKKINWQEAVQPTAIEHLDVITSGSSYFNSIELFSSNQLDYLLVEAKNHYRTIFIDTPNMMASSETRILANQSDGVIIVLPEGKTKVEQLKKVKRVLDIAHAHLVGVILNEI